MNANELRNTIGNNSYFTFTAPVMEAQLISGIIHNAGFDTVTFNRNGESLVVVIDSEFTRNILGGQDTFSPLSESICVLLGEVNENLAVVPSNVDGQFGQATQGRAGVLRHKMASLLDRFGQNAVAEWLREDLELNGEVMDADRRVALQNLLEEYR